MRRAFRLGTIDAMGVRTAEQIETLTLANGLRAVLAPDPDDAAVALAVSYGVGARSEPRSAYAHLVEHLMFQGSANVGPGEHARLIEETGGTFNGTTWTDSTVYHDTVPVGGLDRALVLEADRMAGPRITEQTLAREVAVITEEIRSRVHGRPYGRFPMPQLRELMFSGFANTHDGNGSVGDIAEATVADAQEFFDRWYAPANAVLCVTGRFDPAVAAERIAREFGGLPYREISDISGKGVGAAEGAGAGAAAGSRFAEPDLTGPRRRDGTAAVPLPAFGAAWRVPDPSDLSGLMAYILLADILAETPMPAVSFGAAVDLMGDPLTVLDPNALVVRGFLPPGSHADDVLALVDERLATAADDVEAVRATTSVRIRRNLTDVTTRACLYATFAQQRGDARPAADLPALLDAVTREQVAAAAATLRADRRAVVTLQPESA